MGLDLFLITSVSAATVVAFTILSNFKIKNIQTIVFWLRFHLCNNIIIQNIFIRIDINIIYASAECASEHTPRMAAPNIQLHYNIYDWPLL